MILSSLPGLCLLRVVAPTNYSNRGRFLCGKRTTEIRSEVGRLLLGIQAPGESCASGKAVTLPSYPGLLVEGIDGQLSLPLHKTQATPLASQAEQAPYGKGKETILDTSVRSVLQVSPERVSFSHPDWEEGMLGLVKEAAEKLGTPADLVSAKLYKLLLYEPGSFFLPHQDTEKASGMFATLVVQLPSVFTGGDSIVRCKDGRQRVFNLGNDTGEAAFSSHYMCHFADCEHEVKEVSSGYRLAVVYSLCFTPGRGKELYSVMESQGGLQCAQLSNLRSEIHQLPPDQRLFVLPLEHKYTQASLEEFGFDCLKGVDRARYAALESVEELDLILATACEAHTHGRDNGPCIRLTRFFGDYEIGDLDSLSPWKDGWFDKEKFREMGPGINWNSVLEGGHIVLQPHDGEKSEHNFLGQQRGLLQHTIGADSYPYSGNEGVTTLTAYHATVLIACDKSQTEALIYKEHYREDYEDCFDNFDDSSFTELAKCATSHLGDYESGEVYPETMIPDGDQGGRIKVWEPGCSADKYATSQSLNSSRNTD